ncbi:LPS translocon maturation chaperone LptM [Methylicorpusculum sp.]|nr:lipoprotein [Methylicorpusculum sp.]MDO9238795.1 lipoprotein [Methylicorpusculum sp.]MDP2177572.1 lipoprotein [Methylicorpusculum sp.]
MIKKFIPVLLLFSILLTACGQTGPLYLPDQRPPITVEKEK